MSAEPPIAIDFTGCRTTHLPGGSAAYTAATFAARTLPVLQALDAVLAEDEAGLAQVLSIAEGRRPGVAVALAAALVAEAGHLRRLAQRAEATAQRLCPASVAAEPTLDPSTTA
ncbi:hypothetical protein FV226_21735 [Methylobacterium sp. WL12]|uniref:hypothetical protein n=1 Tax=Methylobacterium sp. WL12 TaxID=2603890 RepID=UPI0011C7C91C|nr:hypothetical protein [Methylobacterium sp. WL12]TXM67550.1 hypothetical protein FV226_21735 [Methylobacterium sp. WL12]